jgi:prepilin-type N-terminal cleavage/methylation domain-containing protein
MSRLTAPERNQERGFSLVEAMCAMAIAAMALVALFRGLGSSQIAANYLEAHLGARIIAQSIIADERTAVETVVGARSGDSGIYRWRLVVEPAEVSIAGSGPPILRLYRVSVDVRWEPRGSFALDGLKAGN